MFMVQSNTNSYVSGKSHDQGYDKSLAIKSEFLNKRNLLKSIFIIDVQQTKIVIISFPIPEISKIQPSPPHS